MRIRIKDGTHDLKLILPTGLVFSNATVWLANHVGRKYAQDALEHISPETLNTLFRELRHIKKKHGRWELVNVESSKGEMVTIIL